MSPEAEASVQQAFLTQFGNGAKAFRSFIPDDVWQSVIHKLTTDESFTRQEQTALNNAFEKTRPGVKLNVDGVHPVLERILQKVRSAVPIQKQSAPVTLYQKSEPPGFGRPSSGRNITKDEAPAKAGASSVLRPIDAETALRQTIEWQLGEGAKTFLSVIADKDWQSIVEKIRTDADLSKKDRIALNNAIGKTWPGAETEWPGGLHPSVKGIIDKAKEAVKAQVAASVEPTSTAALPPVKPPPEQSIHQQPSTDEASEKSGAFLR